MIEKILQKYEEEVQDAERRYILSDDPDDGNVIIHATELSCILQETRRLQREVSVLRTSCNGLHAMVRGCADSLLQEKK